MDVELTSKRDDGTWTWRAAGAKQPKGVVDAALLHQGARTGDVVRVEADVQLDGISVTSVLPPKDKKGSDPRRLEVIGPPAPPPRPASRPAEEPAARAGTAARGRRDEGEGRAHDGGARRRGSPRSGGSRQEERGPGRADGARDGRPRPDRPRSQRDHARPDHRRGTDASAPPKRRSPKRLSPGNVHRAAALAALPPEQRPVGEQLLRGGIPAVRQALEAQNADRRRQGQPEVKADALIALAESLLSPLKAAEWRDRAEAAAKTLDDISLRDLRSVVAGADASARDDETRMLASTLRQAFDTRVAAQRQRWLHDITAALDEDRLVAALRLAARPPDPGARFPGELAMRMSEAAGAAMSPDAPPDQWSAVLAAVVESPVRRTVKPVGLPESGGENLMHAARQACGRVPALAPLLGIDMPPPPGPPRRRPRPGPPRPPPPPAG